MLVESSLHDSQQEHRALLVSNREMNMSKKLKLAFLAAVFTVIGAISAPVLAAGYDEYDNPAINGGGSSGYNAHLGAGNS